MKVKQMKPVQTFFILYTALSNNFSELSWEISVHYKYNMLP